MELEKIFKLVDAGFTKEEIIKLSGAGSEPAKEEPKEEPKKEEPKEEPKKEEPKEEPKKEPAGDPTHDLLKLIADKFDELKSTIQQDNINSTNNKMVGEKTPEELFAEVINPPRKKK